MKRQTSYLLLTLLVTTFCMFWLQLGHLTFKRKNITDKPSYTYSHHPKIITEDKLQSRSLAIRVNNSIQDRLRLVRQKCEAGWKPQDERVFNRMNLFYYDARRKIGYCHAAKTGCTFWLRIFSYLTRKKDLKNAGIYSPFDIGRYEIHSGKLAPKMANFWPGFRKYIYDHTFRFLFARNPYSRLLSVYLDKYYLLAISQTLTKPFEVCETSRKVSFDDFLTIALRSDDHHLLPISDLCNPCLYNPHVIGKMETFKFDAQFILDKADYGSVLRFFNQSLRVEVELESIIKENFAYLANIQSTFGYDCMSAKSLSIRLWNVFKYNGYIRRNLTLPLKGLPQTKNGMFLFFRDIVRNNPMGPEEVKIQKKHYEAKFYTRISNEKIILLQNRYKGDFDLFGYSLQPPEYA